jgi:hypothetical protein
MKNTTAFILCITAFTLTYSQDRTVKELQVAGTRAIRSLDSNGWNLNGTFNISLNQGALSNWVAGGDESVLGINAFFNYAINFRHGKNTWDNYFDLALGFQNATGFGKFRKIDDRIDVTTKVGHLIHHQW